ncbi:hypothetical protein RJ640_016462 [Escallonia rubra]|uniref:Uncharacterized protein n=1 Tax=Escallonia rubra TaxID=112253 RepID=A0AA88UBQ1_9ASTE|nr:hypothetical protein RJ640_016462 [Escallonia rubra]
MHWTSTAKIIHNDGRLQEFRQPVKAGQVLSDNANCFLCSSETMYVDSHVPHVPADEELQLGQLYFLLPISKSQAPLSLQDLCSLAIKASIALSNHAAMRRKTAKSSPFRVDHSVKLSVER